jgi:hypothetical protein
VSPGLESNLPGCAPSLQPQIFRGFLGRAEQGEDDAMREIEIHSYARQLLEAHGARAIAEAAQNAIELESKGEMELARTWRHIEDAMKLMRGPHQS